MYIEYLKKAKTDLVARCSIHPLDEQFEGELPVYVSVSDTEGNLVARARILMRQSPVTGVESAAVFSRAA